MGDGAPAEDGATPARTTEGEVALDDPAVADAVFLTAVDDAVAGTDVAGVVDADPGGVLLLGTTMCDLLADGADAGELLDATLEVTGATADGGDADLAVLAGAVVGAAVEVYCPEHVAAVAELEG